MALLTRQPTSTGYNLNPCAAYNNQAVTYNQDYGQYCQIQDGSNNYQQPQWNHANMYAHQDWNYGMPVNTAAPTYPSYTGPSYGSYTGHGHVGIEYNGPETGQSSLTILGTPQPQPSVSPVVSSCGSSNETQSPGNKQRLPYDWMKKASFHSTPLAGKTRTKDKYRVVYSDHQRLELEKEFHYSRYITIRRKAELAQNLSLSERQVKIWFQNRRAKERKQNKKRDETVTSGSACKVEQVSPESGMVAPKNISTHLPQIHSQMHLHNDMNLPQPVLLQVKTENSIDSFRRSPNGTAVTSLPQPDQCAVTH